MSQSAPAVLIKKQPLIIRWGSLILFPIAIFLFLAGFPTPSGASYASPEERAVYGIIYIICAAGILALSILRIVKKHHRTCSILWIFIVLGLFFLTPAFWAPRNNTNFPQVNESGDQGAPSEVPMRKPAATSTPKPAVAPTPKPVSALEPSAPVPVLAETPQPPADTTPLSGTVDSIQCTLVEKSCDYAGSCNYSYELLAQGTAGGPVDAWFGVNPLPAEAGELQASSEKDGVKYKISAPSWTGIFPGSVSGNPQRKAGDPITTSWQKGGYVYGGVGPNYNPAGVAPNTRVRFRLTVSKAYSSDPSYEAEGIGVCPTQ
jgi:hypothetical protein